MLIKQTVVKIMDEAVLEANPWLKQKLWWEASPVGEFFSITDPEVPSAYGVLNYLNLHRSCVGEGIMDLTTNQVSEQISVSCGEVSGPGSLGGVVAGAGLSINNQTGTVTCDVSKVSNTTMTLPEAPFFTITLPAVPNAEGYTISSTSPVTFKFSDGEDEGYGDDDAARNMSELGLDDLISDAQSAQVTTRRITVNADAPYWKALKGLHEVLDGRHLKFYRGITANIDCQEYGDVECMVLAMVEDIECNDVFLGKYVQGIKGLIIPCEFLD